MSFTEMSDSLVMWPRPRLSAKGPSCVDPQSFNFWPPTLQPVCVVSNQKGCHFLQVKSNVLPQESDLASINQWVITRNWVSACEKHLVGMVHQNQGAWPSWEQKCLEMQFHCIVSDLCKVSVCFLAKASCKNNVSGIFFFYLVIFA